MWWFRKKKRTPIQKDPLQWAREDAVERFGVPVVDLTPGPTTITYTPEYTTRARIYDATVHDTNVGFWVPDAETATTRPLILSGDARLVRSNEKQCEYCTRTNEKRSTCEGCGAPLK